MEDALLELKMISVGGLNWMIDQQFSVYSRSWIALAVRCCVLELERVVRDGFYCQPEGWPDL